MSNPLRPLRSIRLAAVAFALAATLAACGSTTASVAPSPSPTVAPTPTPTATPAPTPSPTPEPTEEPTPEPTGTQGAIIDPTDDLAIAAPYMLSPLQGGVGDLFRDALEQQLGAMAGLINLGAVNVSREGASVGFLLALDLVNIPGSGTEQFTESLIQGASAGGEVRTEEIDGTTVSIIEQQGQAFAVHQQGTLVIFSYGNDADGSLAIAEALIAAA